VSEKKGWEREKKNLFERRRERKRDKNVRRSVTKRERNNGQKRLIGFGQTKENLVRQRWSKKRNKRNVK